MTKLDDLERALRVAYKNVTDAKHMGSFILGFCFIEWLASYYFARQVKAEDYREFVRRFLPGYDQGAMYSALRCGLVHCYTDLGRGIRYDFREDRPGMHLRTAKVRGNSKLKLRVINLSNFQDDLRRAMTDLFRILRANPEMTARALSRFRTIGLISGSIETE